MDELRSQNGTPVNRDYTYLYLSHLIKTPVRYEDETAPFGRLMDIGAHRVSFYPEAVSIIIHAPGRGPVVLPWSAVKSISRSEIVVRHTGEGAPAEDFRLVRDVLDDEVVDTSGARVVRVNDAHLLYSEGRLILGHVEIGALALLRRLGFERPVQSLLRWLLDYNIRNRFVTWRVIEVVPHEGPRSLLRIRATVDRLKELHPAELADVIEQLGARDREALFNALPVETAAEALGEIAPEVQRTLISQEEPAKAADILEEMDSAEAADVLRDMHRPEAQRILNQMERRAAEQVRTILAHEEESAGGIMSTACIESKPSDTAGAILDRIRAHAEDYEVLGSIFVLGDERRLAGVLSLRELLQAAPDAPLDSVMAHDPVTVAAGAKLQDVARLFVKYGFRNLPVVDENGRFLGAVRLRAFIGRMAPLLE